ncbi:MAG: CotH kinase family protein [Acutalibacteraceae bacterium]
MRKRTKRVLSLVLALIICLSGAGVMTAFAASGNPELWVIPFEDEASRVNWYRSSFNGRYYIFLPDGADRTALKVGFSGSKATVNDQALVNGAVTDAFSEETVYVVKIDGKMYFLDVLSSDAIPAVYIETESGSMDAIHADKSHKEKATFAAYENGEKTYDAQLEYIKGRGNSTWGLSKKPYNIKFEKKTDLFGMGKAKKWSLLASALDLSFIRNMIAFGLSDSVGLYYASKGIHVDLYVNGEYYGNYLLCESVEVGSTRVDIDDLDDANEEANADVDVEACELAGTRGKNSGFVTGSRKWVNIPNDPENITGGYLMELEFYTRYDDEISGFTTTRGQCVNFKSPEYATKAQVDYVADLYQAFEDALYSETGYNSQGKHYSEYIDTESFAKMYIMQELSMNIDGGKSSFFITKKADEDKLIASPVWDFDFAFGRVYKGLRVDNTNPWLWYTRDDYLTDDRKNIDESDRIPARATILSQLYSHSDFRALLQQEWNDSYLPELGEERISSLRALAATLESSAVMDALRWNRYSTAAHEENLDGYRASVNTVISFLENRTQFLTKGLSDQAVRLYYDANGAYGIMFHEALTLNGEKTVVKECTFTSADRNYGFRGWNTAADGSGETYQPGDEIVTDGDIVLYAQWGKLTVLEKIKLFISSIIEYIRTIFSKLFSVVSIF